MLAAVDQGSNPLQPVYLIFITFRYFDPYVPSFSLSISWL